MRLREILILAGALAVLAVTWAAWHAAGLWYVP